jgi:hypothetical protein
MLLITSKPIVQKIPLTEEDLAYIKNIMEGGARKETIEHLTEKGWNVDYWLKRRTPMSMGHREDIIKHMFKLGECTICRSISQYKIIQKIPDASVVSWYCEKHLPSNYQNQNQTE